MKRKQKKQQKERQTVITACHYCTNIIYPSKDGDY